MMTEEEARGKWCPMSRSGVDGGGMNRSPTTPPLGTLNGSCRCIASDCAMWRWAGPVDIWQDGTAHRPHTGGIAAGHCGLAGRPEVKG